VITITLAKVLGIVAALFYLGLLVFVHELGHFLAARNRRMSVSSFSIGFGRVLVKFGFRGVQYRLSLLPFGGYVDIMGMSNNPEHGRGQIEKLREQGWSEKDLAPLQDESTWFCNKKPWEKALVSFMGPLFSFLLAIPLIAGALMAGDGVRSFDQPPTIASIAPDSPAQKAGLQEGDRIIGVGQVTTNTVIDMHLELLRQSSKGIELKVLRGEETVSVKIEPDNSGEVPTLGAKYSSSLRSYKNPLDALKQAVVETYQISVWQVQTMGDLFSGHLPLRSLSGPVGILNAGGSATQAGLSSSLMFFAVVTIALAFTNLLPIPVLDGGHITFAIIEGIFGPIPWRLKNYLLFVSAAFLILMIIVVTIKDLGIFDLISRFMG
jgi:regulator of sigma E protease